MSGSLTTYRPTRAEASATFSIVAGYLYNRAGAFSYAAGSLAYAIDTERIGDVDIIVSYHKDRKEALDTAITLLFGRFDNGKPRTQGVIGLCQVDLFPVEEAHSAAVEVFYSHPLPLQIALRAIAAARGYKLTPQGLKDRATNALIPVESKDKLFNLLGVTPFTKDQVAQAAHYKMEEKMEVFSNV